MSSGTMSTEPSPDLSSELQAGVPLANSCAQAISLLDDVFASAGPDPCPRSSDAVAEVDRDRALEEIDQLLVRITRVRATNQTDLVAKTKLQVVLRGEPDTMGDLTHALGTSIAMDIFELEGKGQAPAPPGTQWWSGLLSSRRRQNGAAMLAPA